MTSVTATASNDVLEKIQSSVLSSYTDKPLKCEAISPLIVHPIFEADSACRGWYEYDDDHLRPQIIYGSWPPVTTLKLGGRAMIIDRPVSVKIEYQNTLRDYEHWKYRQQHSNRFNLGSYHTDFRDVEVAYSISYPQTHIWFSGYCIHFDEFENIAISSYNATLCIRPEYFFENTSNCETSDNSCKQYTTQVPLLSHSTIDEMTTLSYEYTDKHFNDCNNPIHIREQYTVNLGISLKSSPYDGPPEYPPTSPFRTQHSYSTRGLQTQNIQSISEQSIVVSSHKRQLWNTLLCLKDTGDDSSSSCLTTLERCQDDFRMLSQATFECCQVPSTPQQVIHQSELRKPSNQVKISAQSMHSPQPIPQHRHQVMYQTSPQKGLPPCYQTVCQTPHQKLGRPMHQPSPLKKKNQAPQTSHPLRSVNNTMKHN